MALMGSRSSSAAGVRDDKGTGSTAESPLPHRQHAVVNPGTVALTENRRFPVLRDALRTLIPGTVA